MLAEKFVECNDKVIKTISDEKIKKSKYFDEVKKPEDLLTNVKLHGILSFIINGFFPEVEEFTRDACDEEKRKEISNNDWKGLRDGLKGILKITDRLPILDDRHTLSVNNAINSSSGTADMGGLLRDLNIWPNQKHNKN
eukprot:GHVR01003488.1.p1 GENE.GHVR01003488.1~~GHVR01003488.1.p1  ORF type:complete len:139 (-),score=9.03 GHVR01003488.1:26-442(-)